eukprot:14029750-Alexandrium_andersonii.AAC.1
MSKAARSAASESRALCGQYSAQSAHLGGRVMAVGPAALGALPCAPEALAGGAPFAEAAAGDLSGAPPLLLVADEAAAMAGG